MWDLYRAHRASRAVVRQIGPLIARSRTRLEDIPDQAWLQPYMVGFMGMLISLLARNASPTIGSQATGLVQQDSWARLTGCDACLIGEEMCLLSSQDDPKFAEGCHAALEVFEWLIRIDTIHTTMSIEDPICMQSEFGDVWIRRFDNRIQKKFDC